MRKVELQGCRLASLSRHWGFHQIHFNAPLLPCCNHKSRKQPFNTAKTSLRTYHIRAMITSEISDLKSQNLSRMDYGLHQTREAQSPNTLQRKGRRKATKHNLCVVWKKGERRLYSNLASGHIQSNPLLRVLGDRNCRPLDHVSFEEFAA
jgi:hypothetical protein